MVRDMLDEYYSKLNMFNTHVWARLKRGHIRVLDAGCGSWAAIEPPRDVKAKITALDISQRQLDRQPATVEKICGDLQTEKLDPESFDLIICLNVLEHLPRPDAAVATMVSALKPKGVLAIAAPIPLSIQGLLTKYSPHLLHVAVYRYIFGQKDAGKDDHAPFPVYLKSFIDPKHLKRHLEACGFEIVYLETYQGWQLRKLSAVMRPGYEVLRVISYILSASSLFRRNFLHTDFQLVAQKTCGNDNPPTGQ